jgi:WXG100 family type VII secretion target
MSGNTTVDRAEMAKAAQQIEEKAGQIHQTQQTLGNQIQNLMGRWQGNAANAFLRAYQDFDGQFSVVQQQLENIHEKLVGSQSTYTQNEADQEAASNAITALLNG